LVLPSMRVTKSPVVAPTAIFSASPMTGGKPSSLVPASMTAVNGEAMAPSASPMKSKSPILPPSPTARLAGSGRYKKGAGRGRPSPRRDGQVHAAGRWPGAAMVPGAMTRSFGLDVGTKTVGVAVSDGLGLTAQPVTTLRRTNLRADLTELRRLAEHHSVEHV